MALDFNLLSTTIPAEAASSAMKGMQQVNALTTQRLANQASGMEMQNALAEQEAWKGASTPQEAQQNLMRGGFGKSAMAIGKNLADVNLTNTKALAERLPVQREMAKDMYNNPSPENIIAHLQDSVQKGWMTPEQAQSQASTLLRQSPEQRRQFFMTSATKADDLMQNLETQRSHKVNENIAGGHLAIAKEAAKGVAQTLTDAAGNVTLLDKQGNIIKQLGPMGKPSATFEKTAALQKQQGKDLNLAITELERATKDKGLIDQSTGSGIGRLVDVSAGAFGGATPGAIAIAKLKPIADMALKMVPRFEGPQSDKDTQSYKEAAGQLADPSLPTDLRKAAGKEVLRLMKARKNQFVNEAMANEGIGVGGGAGVDTSNPLLN